MSLSKRLSNKVFYWKFVTIFDLKTQILASFLWHVIVISLHEQMWFPQQEPTEIQTAEIKTFIQLLMKYSPTTRCILKQDHLWISLNYLGSKTSRHPLMFRAVRVPACIHTFSQSVTCRVNIFLLWQCGTKWMFTWVSSKRSRNTESVISRRHEQTHPVSAWGSRSVHDVT